MMSIPQMILCTVMLLVSLLPLFAYAALEEGARKRHAGHRLLLLALAAAYVCLLCHHI